MRLQSKSVISLFAGLLLVATAFACQRAETPRIELTQPQWQQVQQHLLDETPEPEHPIGVVYDDKVELLGVDIDGEFTRGEEITLTWYWHALEDVNQDWQIFVHFDSQESEHRQNLDHFPLADEMNDRYRTYHWKEGHIVADSQTFTLQDEYPEGDATLYVGLFHGDKRAPATLDGEAVAGNRGEVLTLEVADEEASAPESAEPEVREFSPEEQRELRSRIEETMDRAESGEMPRREASRPAE